MGNVAAEQGLALQHYFVIMGKSSSVPHCLGIEGNNLCNKVIRHTIS